LLILHDGESMEIGRDAACGLIVEDGRVSRRHARLRWSGSGWLLEDLGSKNGTTLNGAPPGASGAELREGDWISLGGLMAQFEQLTATQAANLDSDRLAQTQRAAEMRRRLASDLPPLDLLLRLLELAMDVATAERGFVLLAAPDGRLKPEVAIGFSVHDLREERFRGSVGAVKQALDCGLLAISDAVADPRLGKRPSVVAEGIRSLACVPLRHGDEQLGVLYVDRRKPGPPFSALDVETLETLADRASALLAPALPDWRGDTPKRPAQGELMTQLEQRVDELLGQTARPC
jgi:pSer/pThr/pTyr-binding forkhead associated (FHA) protein